MEKTIFDKKSKISLTVKLEIPVKDLETLIEDVVCKTIEVLLAKFEKERTPEFIPRKEAMKMLKVKTANTMSSWEEKGYLSPNRIGGRIYYRQDELVGVAERFEREIN